MLKKILLSLSLCCFFTTLYSQSAIPDSLASLFYHQLIAFPQEKIYLHTDKPYYLSGEKIWFRAYLTDAVTHVPVLASRYVYIELINPVDSVVTRVKIGKNEEAYYGHLVIPDDAPQGDYSLRAYTMFMRSQDEHFFFTKSIHIGDPQARAIDIDTDFFFETDRRVHATFRFANVQTNAPILPESAKVSVNEGRPMNLYVDADGTATVNFNLPASSRQRVMLLETVVNNISYRRFITIPTPDHDFDLSFYPEGGSLMLGTISKVAFKAIKSNGQPTDITGMVYEKSGVEIGEIRSDYLGMGSFTLLPQKGKSYYVICQNEKGASKRFEIPAAVGDGYALSVSQARGNVYVSVLKPAENAQNKELYLLVHTRGLVQFMDSWDYERGMVVLPKEIFPSGVSHFVLFDANLIPVSERLVFVHNEDQAQVVYEPDKKDYAKRILVKNSVTVTNSYGEPLEGNFSVSVTSDREVTQDSTANILTQLLLTSDLRGHIQNPAYYFQNTPKSASALDLLMRTQGWRRYNITEVAQGRFTQPTSPLETGTEISGTVKGVLTGRPMENVDVTVVSTSLTRHYFNSTQTDRDGRFHLPIGELPDSTSFMVSVDPQKGLTRLELVLEMETFPQQTLSITPPTLPDKGQFAQYADKAEQQYIYEGGIRVTQLEAAVVTAQRQPPKKSVYYLEPDNSLTFEQIEKNIALNVFELLRRIPGVRVILIDGKYRPHIAGAMSLSGPVLPLLLVDDIVTELSYLDEINVFHIAQIDKLTPAMSSIFGARSSGGVIVIHTKDGSEIDKTPTRSFHIKMIMPLGCQQPAEFYAPKYETEAQRNNGKPDLRTTIHWQPVVETDSFGRALFEFYTADEATSYTVMIQGLANDGTIIREEAKLWK